MIGRSRTGVVGASTNSISRLVQGARDLSPSGNVSYEQALQDRLRLQALCDQMEKDFRRKEANYQK